MRDAVDRFYTYVPWVLGIIVLSLALALWHEIQSRPTPGGPSVLATPAKELKGAVVVRVPSAPVRTYSITKAKLKLPPEAKGEVVAAVQVKSDPRPQTVTTVLDPATGDATSYVKVDPYPWFAVEARGEARLAAGYKLRTGGVSAGYTLPVVRLGVSYDLVRVKALTAGVVATADSDGDAFIGAGVAYRW